MGNRSFFNALHDREGDFLLATVLEGPAQGERVLLRNTAPVWPEELPAFWGKHLPALAAVTSSGILKSAGQRIFVERFGAAPQLVVCGGGHVARCLAPAARAVGFRVTVLENRPEVLAEGKFGADIDCRCGDFVESLQGGAFGPNAFFAIMTRGHQDDWVCLKTALALPHGYVGMMGSRGRAALVRRQLLEAGIDAERVEALYAPIGLSIGSQTAEEIALSILAQIVSIKNARPQTEGFSSALLEAMAQTDAAGQQAVLAVIAARHGSTPREIGAKMLVRTDGSIVGSVGGGIMEHRTILAAQEMLTGAAPAYQRLHFSADGKNDDAAIAACGGSMEIVLTRLQPGEEIK